MKLQNVFLWWVLLALPCSPLLGQSGEEPRRVTGKGTASGTDFAAMRIACLNAARTDALGKVGVRVSSTHLGLTTESIEGVSDFFAYFAESSTRGLILQETVVKESNPVRIPGTQLLRMEMEISALVAVATGEPDPGFTVNLETDKTVYEERTPVSLRVSSTKDGYLTVFDVYNDSLSVLYPNSLHPQNRIRRNQQMTLPGREGYSIKLEAAPGRSESSDLIIAVVTRGDVPFAPVPERELRGDRFKMHQSQMASFAKWLHKIPIDQRSSDQEVVKVVRRKHAR